MNLMVIPLYGMKEGMNGGIGHLLPIKYSNVVKKNLIVNQPKLDAPSVIVIINFMASYSG